MDSTEKQSTSVSCFEFKHPWDDELLIELLTLHHIDAGRVEKTTRDEGSVKCGS